MGLDIWTSTLESNYYSTIIWFSILITRLYFGTTSYMGCCSDYFLFHMFKNHERKKYNAL